MARGLWLVVLAAATCASAFEPPRVLIVQQKDAIKENSDANVYVADALAMELDAGGLLAPVVWGMGDPIFRTAALNGTLDHVPEAPVLNEALAGAEKLHAEYTVWVHAAKAGDKAKGLIRLYQGRREIWHDEKLVTVTVSGQRNDSAAAQSLARTWSLLMATKPLKELKPVPKIQTPTLLPGQQPTLVVPPPVEPTKPDKPVDNTQLKQDLAAMVSSGRRMEAILRLRDAIDQQPLDLERRTLLVQTMLDDDPAGAALEARRAAGLFPDHPDLRVMAARAWMRCGKGEEARADLNEAVSRQPNAPTTRLLLAEIALQDGKPEQALSHVEATIKDKPTADGFFYRAVCRSLIGGSDGLTQDLAEVKQLDPNPLPDVVASRYNLAATISLTAMKRAIDDERSLLQRAMVRPQDPVVADEIERLTRLAKARTALLDGLSVPLDSRTAFERRRLAASLVGQSLLDLQQFVSSRDEDSLSEARINLGEASKNLAQ